jgi:regulatory protein
MMRTNPSIKARALRLLAMREHSRAELERKLQAYEHTTGELAQTLDALEAKGLIDAQRVAESVVHRRASRLGSARIRQELRDKGLDDDTVAEALAPLLETEFERARAVWRSRFQAAPADVTDRARQMRFLLARGFSGDVVRRVLAAAGATEDGESFGG